MVKIIQQILKRILPEIDGGYHLARKGKIVAISDPPDEEKGKASDRFRPYYSVDIQMLKADMTDDKSQPVIEALPLPGMMLGNESGLYGFPEVGMIVVIAFAYGSPGHPYVQCVLTENATLPRCLPGEQIWQHSPGNHLSPKRANLSKIDSSPEEPDPLNIDSLPGSYQKADKQGNWERVTNGRITEDSMDRKVMADEVEEVFGKILKKVSGNDKEEIDGTKTIEALGTLLLRASNIHTTSLGSSSSTTVGGHQQLIGQMFKQTLGTGGVVNIALGDYKVETNAGSIEQGNLIGSMGVEKTGLLKLENQMVQGGLKQILEEFLDLIDAFIKASENITVATGTGNSSTPLNKAEFAQLKTPMMKLKQLIKMLLK